MQQFSTMWLCIIKYFRLVRVLQKDVKANSIFYIYDFSLILTIAITAFTICDEGPSMKSMNFII